MKITTDSGEQKSTHKRRKVFIILLLLLLLTAGGIVAYGKLSGSNGSGSNNGSANGSGESQSVTNNNKAHISCAVNETADTMVCHGINSASYNVICAVLPVSGKLACTDGQGNALSSDMTCDLVDGKPVCKDQNGNKITPAPVYCTYSSSTGATCADGDGNTIPTITCMEGNSDSTDNVCRDASGNVTDADGNGLNGSSSGTPGSAGTTSGSGSGSNPASGKDAKQLYVSVAKNPASGNTTSVTVTLATNIPANTPAGWTAVTNQEFTKTYTANTTEYVAVVSATDATNRAGVTIQINNITSKTTAPAATPNIAVSISESPSTPTNGPVVVTITETNGTAITISGWNCSGNRCTKTYTDSGTYPVVVQGANGKSANVTVNVNNIDKTKPTISEMYGGVCTNNQFFVQSSKPLSSWPSGWTSDNGNVYSTSCVLGAVGGNFTDLAGNTTPATWTINGIANP